jgi:hypothetical protein
VNSPAALDAASFSKLEKLVLEQDKHTERECEPYLAYAAGFLVQGTPAAIKAVRQDKNYFGASDVILVASVLNEMMQLMDYASIWELKAPQCYLMEFDDNQNRCRPTIDLIKAENQLLHFGHESQNNDAQRARLDIMDRDRIKLGGIVIGTKDRILRGARNNGDIERAVNSLNIRAKYFYQPHGIKVVTWDRILEYLRPA